MKITRISVSGLFGRFNHDLRFPPDEPITIMIGPNGFGKTMILRIVNALFNNPPRSLVHLPFEMLMVHFDNGTELRVERSNTNDSPAILNVRLTYLTGTGEELEFTPATKIHSEELTFPTGMIEEVIPILDQIGPEQWRHRSTGALLDLEDVLHEYQAQLPITSFHPALGTPDWLEQIRQAIPVRFIDTERLTHALPPRKGPLSRRMREESFRPQRTVRLYSNELAERIQRTLSEYGSLAQSLDRTFPVRLVEEPSQPDYTMSVLSEQLAEVESKRAKLVKAGLLAQRHEGFEIPRLENVDESRRGVLAVYARDAQQKLAIFDDLYARINVLQRIANSRFLQKMVTVGQDGLGVEGLDGSKLELEMLSSGEQHEIVILYELLFRVPNNSFILFDEPELSLHVAWQAEFLNDLEDVAKVSKFSVLLATHSPQIIGDRWDLTVELKGPGEK